MRRSRRLLVDASQVSWWLSVVVVSWGFVQFTLTRDPVPDEGRGLGLDAKQLRGDRRGYGQGRLCDG